MDIILGIEDTDSPTLNIISKSKHAFVDQIQHYIHTTPALYSLPALAAYKNKSLRALVASISLPP